VEDIVAYEVVLMPLAAWKVQIFTKKRRWVQRTSFLFFFGAWDRI